MFVWFSHTKILPMPGKKQMAVLYNPGRQKLPTHVCAVRCSPPQFFVSAVFVAEYIFLMLFHLLHRQYRLFFTSRYYWVLFVLALGGAGNSAFYNPLKPSNGFVIFQVRVRCRALSPFFSPRQWWVWLFL